MRVADREDERADQQEWSAKMRRQALLILLIAALHGACGVALTAAAAHADTIPLLATAGRFLEIHAGAGVALAGVLLALRP